MTDGDTGAHLLVLGPLLRYVGETEATIWVETDRACEVEILGRQARTFEVAGHHYALVVVGRPARRAASTSTRSRSTASSAGPNPDSEFPPSVLRTPDPGRPLRLAFGSCRIAELPVLPRRRSARRAQRARKTRPGRARRLRRRTCAGRRATAGPTLLLLIGDQVYADDPGPATREFIAQRRDPAEPPGYEVADFDEYCALYREAWSEPAVRWLLSVVPTAMIFDDHDVHDDWNTSAAWRRDYQAKPWWPERIRARLPELLDLPAPRQPVPGRTRQGRDCGSRCSSPATRPPCSASFATGPTSGPPASGGASGAGLRRGCGWS